MPGEARSGYAALVCAGDVSDGEILGRLETAGISGAISESGVWAFLDCFGSIEQIPLDEYAKRVLPFDPRNDGYAEKLRSLFVRDGKRRLYIPFTFSASALEHTLAAAMKDIPWSLEYRRGRGHELFYLLLFLLASSAFFIPPLRPALRSRFFIFLPLLPPLVPLAICGASGFAMAALLGGLGVLLLDLFPNGRNRCGGLEGWPTIAAAPLTGKLLPAVMAVAYGVIAFFSGAALFAAVFVPLLFCCVLVILILPELKNGTVFFRTADSVSVGKPYSGHARFSPVPIIGVRAVNLDFSLVMMPYTVAAVLLVLAGFVVPVSLPVTAPILPKDNLVTEADYLTHYTFQAGFSYRSLNTEEWPVGGLPSENMPGYALAGDGLPYPAAVDAVPQAAAEIPPFPIADLVTDLESGESLPENGGGGSDNGRVPGDSPIVKIFSTILSAVFVIPALVRRKAAGKLKKIKLKRNFHS